VTASRVFIVDDEPICAKSMSGLLQEEGYFVEIFPSAEAFLEREPYTGVGCLLLDLNLPGMSGVTLLETLRRKPLTTPIIIVTGVGDIPESVRTIKLGAVDFLRKPIKTQTLVAAIEQALPSSRRIQPFCSRLATLSPREREVLDAMLLGLLNKQIAVKLGISEKTTKIHRGHIMEKLGVPSLPELVRRWVESGLPLREHAKEPLSGPSSAATAGPPPAKS